MPMAKLNASERIASNSFVESSGREQPNHEYHMSLEAWRTQDQIELVVLCNTRAMRNASPVQPKHARIACRIASSLVPSTRARFYRFRNDTNEKGAHVTVRHTCDTHGIDICDSCSDALEKGVEKDTGAMVAEHAEQSENRLSACCGS